EVSVMVELNSTAASKFKLLGVAFDPNHKVELEVPSPSSLLLRKAHGNTNPIIFGGAGRFKYEIVHTGGADTLSFDLKTKNGKPLTFEQNFFDNFFAVELEKIGGHHHHEFFASAQTDPPVGPTPIPGALALFAPVFGVGYAFLRRREQKAPA